MLTRENFKELFSEQLNAKVFAEAIGTSEGHVNELRRKPNVVDIAETFGLIVEDVEEVLKRPNLDALYDFYIAKNVELTEEQIVNIQQKTKRESKAIKLEVGLVTPLGRIVKINKVGKTNVYMIMDAQNNLDVYGTQEVLDAINPKSDEEVNE